MKDTITINLTREKFFAKIITKLKPKEFNIIIKEIRVSMFILGT
jgi:hypothetical protein